MLRAVIFDVWSPDIVEIDLIVFPVYSIHQPVIQTRRYQTWESWRQNNTTVCAIPSAIFSHMLYSTWSWNATVIAIKKFGTCQSYFLYFFSTVSTRITLSALEQNWIMRYIQMNEKLFHKDYPSLIQIHCMYNDEWRKRSKNKHRNGTLNGIGMLPTGWALSHLHDFKFVCRV